MMSSAKILAGLELRPIEPFGSTIYGLDLTKPSLDRTMSCPQKTFPESAVIVLREPRAKAEQLIDFSQRFGALDTHVLPQSLLPQVPQIFAIGNKCNKAGRVDYRPKRSTPLAHRYHASRHPLTMQPATSAACGLSPCMVRRLFTKPRCIV